MLYASTFARLGFYSLCIAEMSYTLTNAKQFRHCQATDTTRTNEDGQKIFVFYSYTCPELVKIGWNWYKFDYENSRKAGAITSSPTTSKQCNNFLRSCGADECNLRKLPTINLATFEADYFDTRLEKYY